MTTIFLGQSLRGSFRSASAGSLMTLIGRSVRPKVSLFPRLPYEELFKLRLPKLVLIGARMVFSPPRSPLARLKFSSLQTDVSVCRTAVTSLPGRGRDPSILHVGVPTARPPGY